jgi:hypothetical protein
MNKHRGSAVILALISGIISIPTTALALRRELPAQKQAVSPSEECNELISVANQAVADVQMVTSQSDPSSQSLLALADITEQAGITMEAIAITDPQLQDYQAQFVEMYVATTRASRDLVTAVEQDDPSAAQDAYASLLQATSQEGVLVNAVNIYCGVGES